MREPNLRALLAALCAATAFHGCGSSSFSFTGNNAAATTTAFYVSGKTGVATGNAGHIGLSSYPAAGAAADPYDLVVVDPAATTASSIVVNTVAPAGTWLPMASVAQWTDVGNGLASSWAPRYLIYAQLPAGSANLDAPLYLLDLGKTAGRILPGAGIRFSTASTVTSSICNFGVDAGLVLDDLPTPSRSWATLRVAGPDGSCTTLDNRTIAIPLTAGAGTAPVALGLAEPVEAMHGADGSLTGAIELVHILPSDVGTKAPTLQMTDANLGGIQAIGTSQPLQGTGNTTSGTAADFQSLGITASGVWLYRDASNVMAINLGSPATATTLFSLAGTPPAGDVLQAGHALFDPNGTVAYVAVTHPGGTSRIVRLDASVSPPVASTVVAETAATRIQLVGLTAGTGFLLYVASGQPAALKAVPKGGTNVTAALIVTSLGASQTFDAVPPAVVGEFVYYTVDDSSGGINPYRQLYSALFHTGGVSAPIPFAAAGTGCAVLVRPAYATPLSSNAPAPYGSVLVANGPSFCLVADAALAYANALLYSRDSNGNTVASGQLPLLGAQLSPPPPNGATALNQVDFAYFFGGPGTSVQLDGPVQSGMPTLLELDGATAQSIPAIDIELFTPGAAIGPLRLTHNLP